jgi:hypothetical protein
LVVEHDLQELALGQGAERATYLATLVNGGIMLANEARNLIGLEDTAGGDILRSPVNTAPAVPQQNTPADPQPKPNGAMNGAGSSAGA